MGLAIADMITTRSHDDLAAMSLLAALAPPRDRNKGVGSCERRALSLITVAHRRCLLMSLLLLLSPLLSAQRREASTMTPAPCRGWPASGPGRLGLVPGRQVTYFPAQLGVGDPLQAEDEWPQGSWWYPAWEPVTTRTSLGRSSALPTSSSRSAASSARHEPVGWPPPRRP